MIGGAIRTRSEQRRMKPRTQTTRAKPYHSRAARSSASRWGVLFALAPCAVDQEILGDATKKSARIDKLVALRAARRAREDFLHKVRRFLWSRLAAQEMKERRAMRPVDSFQILPGARPLFGRRRTIVGMRMAGRRHRKGVAGRRTIVAGTGRHDSISRRHERTSRS